MQIAFTHWSYSENPGTWPVPTLSLYSWVLSVMLAKEAHRKVLLFTDSPGKALLVDSLKLPFDEVSTALDNISSPALSKSWMLGKFHSYRLLAERGDPFIHLDADFYLQAPLPERIILAELSYAHPEVFPNDFEWYTHALKLFMQKAGWIPEALVRDQISAPKVAFCTGLFGGSDMVLIKHYVEQVSLSLEATDNKQLWQDHHALTHAGHFNMLVVLLEQYLLAACCSAWGVRAEPVFQDPTLAVDYKNSPYLHFYGGLHKGSAEYQAYLVTTVQDRFPAFASRAKSITS